MEMFGLTREEGERALEQLRYGIPPSGATRQFTVGRDDQIGKLAASLKSALDEHALLIHANYGAGKSHLLRVLREIALEQRFVIALITVDADGGVRFNRMDTIFGAVCRAIEVPGHPGSGVGTLFDAYREVDDSLASQPATDNLGSISPPGHWNCKVDLEAPGIRAALRAWVHATEDRTVRGLITDWLSNPENYRSQRKLLYKRLVEDPGALFSDLRPEWQFYRDGVFVFHVDGHRQSWSGLADLDRIARFAGYGGLVLLVDEFEDIIQNLRRRDHQKSAFQNLFNFFFGDDFPGQSYFAVTPDFTRKCEKELSSREVYDFDHRLFDDLPFFRLDPIDAGATYQLAERIRALHGYAYGWNSGEAVDDQELKNRCDELMRVETPDKIRQAIKAIVGLMDARLDEG